MTGRRWVLRWGLVCAVLSAIAVVAQDDKVPTLHVYNNLLQIPTLVLGLDRRPLPPIAESRFYVSLDGGPKFRVTHVRPEGDDPISLSILMDLNQPDTRMLAIMDGALASLAGGALKEHDHVLVYAMDCQLVRAGGEVSVNAAALQQAVDLTLQGWRARNLGRFRGSCPNRRHLWDSLGAVASMLTTQRGRRVILAVTNGVDDGSKNSWEAVRSFAQQNGVAIFGLTSEGLASAGFGPRSLRPEDDLVPLCEPTGGMVMNTDERHLSQQLQTFLALLRGRYIVEFPRPWSATSGSHEMEITIQKMAAFIRPAGIGVPVDDPALLKDPNTVLPDPSHAPQMGKKRNTPN